jgi:uncharacterized protein (TIGR02996 family)
LSAARALLLACAAASSIASASTVPFTPRLDDEVVERLPLRAGSPQERARLRAEQRLLVERPRDLGLALRAARDALERGRLSGDERELGTAQAWLQPWWQDPHAPAAALLLKATVLQARHQFDAALAELDRLPPRTQLPPLLAAQAELTRAAILQLRGRWTEARSHCQWLAAAPMAQVHGAACLAELDSLQGRTVAAAQALAALERRHDAPHAWIALLRAEAAQRDGRTTAGALYARALQLRGDVYVRAAYADWLLEAGQPAQAAAVVQTGQPEADLPDALLLRLAIAWRRLGDAGAGRATAALQERFAAAAQRGADASHARERARFALDVLGDSGEALRQARLNWNLQCEPADALLLWRAAQAAGRPDAAQPVRDFIREHGLQDRRLKESA